MIRRAWRALLDTARRLVRHVAASLHLPPEEDETPIPISWRDDDEPTPPSSPTMPAVPARMPGKERPGN